MEQKVKEQLKERFVEQCLFGEPLLNHTTYKTGGKADAFVSPKNEEDLVWLLKFCKKNKLDFFVLGFGSNVLISDKGFKGIVICTKGLVGTKIENKKILCKAGTTWDEFVEIACENSFYGIEELSGIPGTVGGAIYMNAGAFSQATFNTLLSFEGFYFNGNKKTFFKKDLKFGYRKVEGIENFIITSATFSFENSDRKQLEKIREEVLDRRADGQPLNYPSAGSVFKRPKDGYASQIIDETGLKGLKVGGAEVSKKHAGFIINRGGATSQDIYKLIQKIKAKVLAKKNIELELEQKLIGSFK
ncbi:MAG: UDP-N-acetylmuramate dehydrogenase [Elusimicrobiaceae bacterium]|jgi:UDP-N-acetylmuramate dehydrogenase|nr:UDP-N-acetylmuramate dehydrogenase [Elusimicrobiaceae bacterium]MBT3954696.1 UDP-N-acetylmuramate dehydrogenase [Elusimicrobiaceae bacterium]MBT4008042.1 UDP-N-acetylmuramate dehydrogenase [Elusimicrobiaceae bacterium]MBT4402601.1 UDP-N-acetylmuramate dehydrogenase [Elusimicrobiaceae bacterium]MBT4439356.1 UDP-N-acetylmuramate dehydrogenase [Elusimicrobiaceae bacterium]